MKKFLSVLMIISLVLLIFVSCSVSDSKTEDKDTKDVNDVENIENIDETPEVDTMDAKYDEACELLEKGDYLAAQKIFKDMGDDERAKEELGYFYLMPLQISNENGIDQVVFNEQDLPVQKSQTSTNTILNYTWSEDLRNVKESCEDSDGYSIITDYSYDVNGDMIRKVTNSGEYTFITDYNYNENRKLTEIVYTFPDESYTTYYTYDENGNITEEVGDSLYCEYQYDESGRLIRMYSEQAKAPETINYTYDANGNIKREDINSFGIPSTVDYFYDENRNVISKVYNSAGVDSRIYYYSYDENQNLIKEETVNFGGDDINEISEYTYDENGNLRKKTIKMIINGECVSNEIYEYKLVYIPQKLPAELLERLEWK